MDSELLKLLSEFAAVLGAQMPFAAAAGTVLMLLLRLYRLPALQNLLPKRARWDALHPYAKVGLPFAVALVGSLLVSLGSGAAVLSSFPAALMAALGAIGLHHVTKAAGQASTNMALKAEGPSYTPSPFRRAASIVVPLGKIPQDVFDKAP